MDFIAHFPPAPLAEVPRRCDPVGSPWRTGSAAGGVRAGAAPPGPQPGALPDTGAAPARVPAASRPQGSLVGAVGLSQVPLLRKRAKVPFCSEVEFN